MHRRRFITTSATLALAGAAPLRAADHESAAPQYLEWIRFEILNNSARRPLVQFLGRTVIPALNAHGIHPVGLFRPRYGAHGSDLYLLVPHPDLESFQQVWTQLEADPAFIAAADTSIASPLYERMTSSLMVAFSHMPKVEVPKAVAGKAGRIFELRTYEAHNRLKLNRKVEMFNEGGEIALFRETGLHPVFFGKMLAGDKMPNLTYMLGFESMEQRDANWKTFVNSEGWKAMKDLPRYADTVSSITDTILVPSGDSQI